MTRAPRVNRRSVLRGLGGIAIGLPWLELMDQSSAMAQTVQPARRFVGVYQPGGTVRERWRVDSSAEAFELSPILAPLQSVKDHILVLDGLTMSSAIGEQHQAGIVALLTGTPQDAQRHEFAGGPSIDQVLAERLSEGLAHPSLHLAVRWATGRSHGLLHPINSLSFANDAQFSPIPPRVDPVELWDMLFSDDLSDASAHEAVRARKESILDYVTGRYQRLSEQLGASDRQRLEQHLEKLRELERSLEVINDAPQCPAPQRVDTSDYNPTTGIESSDDGSLKDVDSDAAIPKVGKYMLDMLVTALACDRTAVATFQWSDTEAKHTFPWLGLSEHHHYFQHDGGFRPEECERIALWYSEQHAYLLQQLQAVDLGDHTLLDESVVFFGTELSDPPTHDKSEMPFLLAGGGGGLSGGRVLQAAGRSHNDLLVSLFNICGDERATFGAAEHCDGAIEGLRRS